MWLRYALHVPKEAGKHDSCCECGKLRALSPHRRADPTFRRRGILEVSRLTALAPNNLSTEFPVKPGVMLIEVLGLGGARDRGWGCLADRRKESDCISLRGLEG